jgi:hypothetical protein
MRNKKSVLVASLLWFLFSSLGQVAQSTFFKVYPTLYDKTSRDILETADGGYIICGMTNNSNLYDCDLYVMKTDGAGNMQWEKSFGGSKPDYAYSMVQTNDGNYLITGYSQSFGGGDMDVYLVKISPSGSLIWQKTYIGWGNEEAREIIKSADGNYIIVGSTNSNLPSQDAFLMKVDGDGAVIWIKYYGGSGKEFGNSVKQCSDGGYYMLGETFSYGQGGDAYLVRTNAGGDTLWTRHYGGALNDEGVWVEVTNDGAATLAVRDSCNGKDVDTRIMQVNANGALLWSKLYAGNLKDTPKTLRRTADGGYLIGAISRSFGWVNPDMWILKTNSSGDTLWSRHYGDADHEHCHHAKPSGDGGILAVGHSRSYSPGQKVMFLKLNSSGVVSADEQFVTTQPLNVFPNPSSGHLSFRHAQSGPCKVNVYNALGEAVFAESLEYVLPGQVSTIDLGRPQAGIYILTIESQGRKRASKIVVKD